MAATLKTTIVQEPSSATANLTLGTAGQVQIGAALGAGGANYGTSGQVLTSGGSGSAPSWTSLTGAVYITSGSGDTSFTNIGVYSKLLLIYTLSSTSSATLTVALSSNNGTSYGAAKTIASVATATTGYAIQSGFAEISNTGTSGTTKTITPFANGGQNSGTNEYTTTSTDAVTTGVINAIQLSRGGRASYSLWGIP